MKKATLLLLLILGAVSMYAQGASEDLLRASITGDMEGLMEALGKGAKPDVRDGEGRTPLSLATKLGHTPLTIILIDRGATVDAKDNDGRTALMHAAWEGQLEPATVLLEKGANMELRDKSGKTPLMLAAENGQHEVMGLLLERGAQPKFTKDEDLENATTGDSKEDLNASLLNAILNHDEETARRALANGANPDARSKRHIPALIMSASRKQEGIVHALLEAGADANIRATDAEKGIEQITPLHVAAANGNVEILTVLLLNGAKANSQEKTGLTPLMSAAELGNIVNIILLIDHGAEVNLQAYDGASALIMAVGRGNADATRILLEKGADVNLADGEMTTPLMIACQQGDVEVVQLLMEHGADIKLRRGANGYRAADFARLGGHKEVLKLLKETE